MRTVRLDKKLLRFALRAGLATLASKVAGKHRITNVAAAVVIS